LRRRRGSVRGRRVRARDRRARATLAELSSSVEKQILGVCDGGRPYDPLAQLLGVRARGDLLAGRVVDGEPAELEHRPQRGPHQFETLFETLFETFFATFGEPPREAGPAS